MAQVVQAFCSKAKGCKQPTIEFEEKKPPDPSFTCKITLHAYCDGDNDGFPEMMFQDSARAKKAAKAAAMNKLHSFLSGTPVFKKVMKPVQVCRRDLPACGRRCSFVDGHQHQVGPEILKVCVAEHMGRVRGCPSHPEARFFERRSKLRHHGGDDDGRLDPIGQPPQQQNCTLP
jgi:hypothetical protein